MAAVYIVQKWMVFLRKIVYLNIKTYIFLMKKCVFFPKQTYFLVIDTYNCFGIHCVFLKISHWDP